MRVIQHPILIIMYRAMRAGLCLGLLCFMIVGAYLWMPANVYYHVTERYIFSNLGDDTQIYLGVLLPKSGPYQWVKNYEINWDGTQQLESYDSVDVVKLSGSSDDQGHLEATIEYDVKLPQRSVRWSAPVENYQRLPQAGIESDCECLEVQASDLCDGSSEKDAYSIYSFITDYLTYSKENMDCTSSSALKAYEIGSCVCAGYARLMTALCRASDIPSQMVIGFVYPDPVYKSETGSSLKGETHAWVEYYSEGNWKLADPTYGARHLKILHFNRNDGRHISYGELEHVLSVDKDLQTWAISHGKFLVGDDDCFRYIATSTSGHLAFREEMSIHRRWDVRWINTLLLWGSTTWFLCKFRYKIIGFSNPNGKRVLDD